MPLTCLLHNPWHVACLTRKSAYVVTCVRASKERTVDTNNSNESHQFQFLPSRFAGRQRSPDPDHVVLEGTMSALYTSWTGLLTLQVNTAS